MSEQNFWLGGSWRVKARGRQISAQSIMTLVTRDGRAVVRVSEYLATGGIKQRLGGQGRRLEGGSTPVGNGIGRYVSPFHR